MRDGELWAMADGGRRVEVDRLDPATCAVVERRTAAIDPYDPEDLALGPDGALWVGDIGDNDRARRTVAVIVLPARGEPVLHRLTYPDGPHDAEALLADAQGRVVVVTKEVTGLSGIYRAALDATALEKVGEVRLPDSTTVGGPVGSFGDVLVTGAAVSGDGRVVALRSYTDAWLYPVPVGGDVVEALAGAPVQVPLGGEPQGEAVAFDADGTLVSGSESRGGVAGQIREVAGAAAVARDGTAVAPSTEAPPEPAVNASLIGVAALVGVLVLGAVAMAVHGARRRR
ncbi:MAG: hypothetical protein J0I49_15135 [Pseudonocardia sp.]|uniref:hypothetical protein n=1 Tax=Pseudonocardia sp. TaxID=60912 RepID=UPI001AC14826|nr:hypothetical protein [Pseudonocardia sp.]MBN9099427.1 hypothetical protein [Pseudonocardia sp.]